MTQEIEAGLDVSEETGQISRTGLVSPSDIDVSVAESLAKRMGWRPKDEWTRDPAKWRDAVAYLGEVPNEINALKERNAALKERNQRTAQAADAVIEQERARARQEAQEAIRAAAEAQDPDAAARAAERLASVSGPPPQTVAWLGRNGWFNSDMDAQALATAAINRAAQAGKSIDEQLEAGEEAVKRRFPEHFGGSNAADRGEVRLSEAKAAPHVQSGARAAPVASREKGFGDIPSGDRAIYTRVFAKRYEGMGLKPAEAQAKYAASYWANKGS